MKKDSHTLRLFQNSNNSPVAGAKRDRDAEGEADAQDPGLNAVSSRPLKRTVSFNIPASSSPQVGARDPTTVEGAGAANAAAAAAAPASGEGVVVEEHSDPRTMD